MSAEILVEPTATVTTMRYGLHFKEGHIPHSTHKDLHKKHKVRHTYRKMDAGEHEKSAGPSTQNQLHLSPGGSRSIGLVHPTPQVTHKPVKTFHQVPVTGTKRALLIGINYIGTNNRLNGCIKDVQNIYALLTTTFGYKPENIQLLSDDQQGEFRPTRENIINHINTVVALTKPGDELFVHYSGHGTQVAAADNNEDLNPDTPGQDDALCPCDFDDYNGDDGFIVDDVLKEILVNKIPVGAKLRCFFDCCHSGSALDLPFLYRLGDYYMQVEPLDKQSADCLLISGCKDNQTSADAFIKGQYSGALTWAILEALKSPMHNKMTWKEFLLVVQHSLVVAKYTQIPMLSVGDQSISDFLIDL